MVMEIDVDKEINIYMQNDSGTKISTDEDEFENDD